ncbi:MAG: DUF4870 domain-containing protein [Clostridiales bacterium]|nr:DUF4870 domain-containing protein [Clostridiales bacterium]
MSNKTVGPHNSSLGNLEANILALLSYLVTSVLMFIPGVSYFAWILPLVIYLLENKSSFVKFHALQSMVVHAISALIRLVLNVIIGSLFFAAFLRTGAWFLISVLSTISTIVSVVIAVFSILAMIKAYQYTEYNIPLIGPITSWVSNLISGKNKTEASGSAAGNAGQGAEANVQHAAQEQPAAQEQQPVEAASEKGPESES